MPNVITVTTKGPLFDGQAPAVIRREINGMVQDLVEAGEQRLDLILRPRPGGVFLSVAEAAPGKGSSGNYRRNVHGMVKEMHGLITDGGVIYGPWLEGLGSRNATSRFKGYASFRKTGQWLNSQVSRIANARVSRLVENLNRGV